MNIYPLGTCASANSSGTIDSISYSMFEPNLRCKSSPIFTILNTRWDNQTMQTRQKAEPYLSITYEYENIYDKEYKQIEHFIYSVAQGGVVSFHVVDFSAGVKPTSVTNSSGDWIVAIPNTRLYSAQANRKAANAFLWNGKDYKEGDIVTVTANTSIKVDVDTNNYGNLSLANANSYAWVYPLYEVYVAENALSQFNTTVNIDEENGIYAGYMRSGSIGFFTRYKV